MPTLKLLENQSVCILDKRLSLFITLEKSIAYLFSYKFDKHRDTC